MQSDALIVAATDLLALTLLRPPAESSVRISLSDRASDSVYLLGSVGPTPPSCTTLTEYERFIPGRVVGLSKDDEGGHAFRLARQTREQHIRREKATSNICTAQVLLAVMASMYAVYHGPEGLRKIALQSPRDDRPSGQGSAPSGFRHRGGCLLRYFEGAAQTRRGDRDHHSGPKPVYQPETV